MALRISSATINAESYNNVQGHQLNNSNNTTTIVYGNLIQHTTIVDTVRKWVERMEYDEFHKVKRGDIIASQDLYSEDLSRWEWQIRVGRVYGRLKARVTTQTSALFSYGDAKFTVVKYEGMDAEKAWKRDFRIFSRMRVPGLPQLFAINQSSIPMLVFHQDLGHLPARSLPVEWLDWALTSLSLVFDHLREKKFPSFLPIPRLVVGAAYSLLLLIILSDKFAGNSDGVPESIVHPANQLRTLYHTHKRGASPMECEKFTRLFLAFLRLFGLEIDAKASDHRKWVRVKNSDSDEQLDDDEDYDSELSLNGTPSVDSCSEIWSTECPTLIGYSQNALPLTVDVFEYDKEGLVFCVESDVPEDDTEEDDRILYPRFKGVTLKHGSQLV